MCQKINEELVGKMEERLNKAFPEGKYTIDDMDSVHIKLNIVSNLFEGLPLLKQHQLVYNALNDLLESGELHSVKIKTLSK